MFSCWCIYHIVLIHISIYGLLSFNYRLSRCKITGPGQSILIIKDHFVFVDTIVVQSNVHCRAIFFFIHDDKCMRFHLHFQSCTFLFSFQRKSGTLLFVFIYFAVVQIPCIIPFICKGIPHILNRIKVVKILLL